MKKLKQECLSMVIFLLVIYIGIFMNINKYGVGDSQVFLVSIIALIGWSLWLISFCVRFLTMTERGK